MRHSTAQILCGSGSCELPCADKSFYLHLLSFSAQLPSYKNFKGVIHELGQNQYLVSGEVSVIDKNTIEITELPVRTWTQVQCRM